MKLQNTEKWTPDPVLFKKLEDHYADRFDANTMMCLPLEQAYYRWIAENRYKGDGAIVELGCFLGSSSIPLIEGLLNNPKLRAEAALEVFDRFVWDEGMAEWTGGRKDLGPLKVGDNYQSLYLEKLGSLSDRVSAHEKDFSNLKIEFGPTEILIVDVMKTFALTENVAESFFPGLLEGGLILHQDYLHYSHGWILILTWRMREHLNLVWCHDNRDVALTAFEVTAPIPKAKCLTLGNCYLIEPRVPYNPDEILAAFEWNRSIFPPSKHFIIDAAEIFILAITGYAEPLALERLRKAKRNPEVYQSRHFFELRARLKAMKWDDDWLAEF